ncbi:hypothetical protein VTK73DRAFT_4195 [Phialemonium thermophilum]|uniref:Uncharacterized protein n=1 Tax=Phialemonium thermophilum TaxID=223376 RepID=A0ABR3VCL7_9PEZI
MVRGLARYPTGDDVESVFQRLLVGGARVVVPPAEPAATATGGNDGDDNDGVATMAQLYAAFRRHHMMLPGESTRTGPVGHLPWDETMALAAPYGLSARRAAYGRTLFTTRKGYAGLGPRSTKAGDSVVLLRGGRTAYVLRKGGKKRPGIYTFLGEAYVHGLMRGEGVRGGSDLEDFEIV